MDDLQPLQPQIQYQELLFDGDRLVAIILQGDGIAVPVRDYCTALGLDLDKQGRLLRAHGTLSLGLRVVRIPYQGRIRSITAILHRFVPMWLAHINPRDVEEALQPKLIRYQLEIVDLLATMYANTTGAGLMVPTNEASAQDIAAQRLTEAALEARQMREQMLAIRDQLLAAQDELRAEMQAQLDNTAETVTAVQDEIARIREEIALHTTITGPQQEFIQRSITQLAARLARRDQKRTDGKGKTKDNYYMALHIRFRQDLGTPRYDALPAGKYNDALDWITERWQEFFPDDPDAAPPRQEALL